MIKNVSRVPRNLKPVLYLLFWKRWKLEINLPVVNLISYINRKKINFKTNMFRNFAKKFWSEPLNIYRRTRPRSGGQTTFKIRKPKIASGPVIFFWNWLRVYYVSVFVFFFFYIFIFFHGNLSVVGEVQEGYKKILEKYMDFSRLDNWGRRLLVLLYLSTGIHYSITRSSQCF